MSVVDVYMTETMTTAEAAQHYHVSERTIRRWIQSGKLQARWTNGQWAVRADNRLSFRPHDREDDRTEALLSESSDRLTEPEVKRLWEELETCRRQLERVNFKTSHLVESLEEKRCEIKRLELQLTEKDNQLARRDTQIDSLTQEIDHLTQLLALKEKNVAALTEQLDDSRRLIEDMRRPWWKRVFRRQASA